MRHRWKTDNFGKVDNFAFEHANHNGPVCVVCGKSFCEHCEPECYDADDCNPVNIDLALAQIAEMESAAKGMPYLQPFDDNGVTNFKAMRTNPLTWEELAAMIGKPIYIADLVDVSESNWAIVGKAYSKLGLEFITLYDTIEGDVGCQELYGESWLAYRYEPKGEKA